MPKIALITGITGQDGSYLAELLLSKDYEVHGIVRRTSGDSNARIAHLLPRLALHMADLTDGGSVARVVDAVAPTEVYNLAAQSHVATSFAQPEVTFDITAMGAHRLLDAVRRYVPDARFYQASTSELYGLAQELPQNEVTRFCPCSPYGIAKLAAYWMTHTSRVANGLHASNGILFNHESPRRGQMFVSRKITAGLARVRAGLEEFITLGNLNVKRDWGYAGDYVQAMWQMLQRQEPGNFVIATGRSHTVREFVEIAANCLGFRIGWKGEGMNEVGIDGATGRVLVNIARDFYRPTDPVDLVGDASLARRELGWAPSVAFAEMVQMMVRADIDALPQRLA